jgi:hypothetical protein
VVHLPRRCDVWLPGYVSARIDQLLEPRDATARTRVWLTMADHFEPLGGGASEQAALDRVETWRRHWPDIAARHADATGHRPVHTFFYPEEEYRPRLLEPLADLTAQGIADVEVHIHHDGEGAQNFVDRMGRFVSTLESRHGLLRRDRGQVRFGFIHGNWALANSLPDGRWCGVDHEITLLRELGCYADFTMPSGARESQARMVNRIYWATDKGNGRKTYDTGTPLRPGGPSGDLLMIPGPLGPRWRERRIETGEVAVYDLPTAYRVARWLAIAPRVGNDVFIKLFTHGAQERHMGPLLGGGLRTLFDTVAAGCRRLGWELHYVSAWEMYRAAIAISLDADPVALAVADVGTASLG